MHYYYDDENFMFSSEPIGASFNQESAETFLRETQKEYGEDNEMHHFEIMVVPLI
jgi:hypothetical protein